MESSQFDAIVTAFARSRRTLLGGAVAATGTAIGVTSMAGKKKKKKKCKAPTTKCGKKTCCRPGETCTNGTCTAPATTTPKPFTAVRCNGPKDSGSTGAVRFAQIFEASGTGLIATASFELNALLANQPFGVEIRTTQNGAPTNTVLGTAIIFGLPANPGILTVTATFAPKVAVEQGTLYALTFTDLAKKGFLISTRNPGACAGALFADTQGNNSFVSVPGSLVFSVSP